MTSEISKNLALRPTADKLLDGKRFLLARLYSLFRRRP